MFVEWNEKIMEEWKRHFESVISECLGRRVEVTSIGIKLNAEWSYQRWEMERCEIEEAIKKVKCRKGLLQADIHVITAKMLKYFDEVVECIYNLAWKHGEVLED